MRQNMMYVSSSDAQQPNFWIGTTSFQLIIGFHCGFPDSVSLAIDINSNNFFPISGFHFSPYLLVDLVAAAPDFFAGQPLILSGFSKIIFPALRGDSFHLNIVPPFSNFEISI